MTSKWHGSFASGATLHEAMHATRAVDHAAEFCIRVRELERTFGAPATLPTTVAAELGGAGTRVLPPADADGHHRPRDTFRLTE